jgi:fumarylpyruvate hydrolase
VSDYVFELGPRPALPIQGTDKLFPIRRVYCVGRNYADHIVEMGNDPNREKPFFFQKPTDAIVPEGGKVPYPPLTKNLHHEVEYVLAIGKEGFEVAPGDAASHVYGVALGIDLTRRDLQFEARDAKRPWEVGKAFDHAGPCSAIKPLNGGAIPKSAKIRLSVNGTVKQNGDIGQMIWNADEVVAQLSLGYRLMPGDLIFTGTPAGVGPLQRGDKIDASLEGIAELHVEIV